MTQTELRITAEQYKDRIRASMMQRPTLEVLMLRDEPITKADLDKMNNDPHKYENRDRIPEPLLVYSDLYHELTGQEMLKMDVAGYIEVFQEWKDRTLQPEDIRGAWAKSRSERGGFPVGHPRALTTTAKAVKSEIRPVMPVISTARIEQTQVIIEEKVKLESTFVPMPDEMRERLRAKLAMKGR